MNRNLKLLNHLAPEFHYSFNLPVSNHKMLKKHFTPNIPAWFLKQPEHFEKKSESNPHILKDDFRKLQSCYKNYK